jgi:hypothetical protein
MSTATNSIRINAAYYSGVFLLISAIMSLFNNVQGRFAALLGGLMLIGIFVGPIFALIGLVQSFSKSKIHIGGLVFSCVVLLGWALVFWDMLSHLDL